MSRNNDPIEREGPDHSDIDVPPDQIPVPDGEPLPSPVEEPPDEERAPIQLHDDSSRIE